MRVNPDKYVQLKIDMCVEKLKTKNSKKHSTHLIKLPQFYFYRTMDPMVKKKLHFMDDGNYKEVSR